ncbi:MAG: DUF115 domain-containing protein [Flavobacteriales bacterium]|nr:DUF115 domain-containing protein [Flavobacteriales bacterium]
MLDKISRKRRSLSNPRYWWSYNVFPLTPNDQTLKGLENKHAGKRCFIIGNGPSLNKLDLKRLQNEYTFGTNAIYLNHDKMGFYPTYYAVEDHFVAEDRADEINKYKESLKFFPNYVKHCITPDEKTLFVNFLVTYPKNDTPPSFSTNAAVTTYFGGTVSYLCMQLAYFMGFTEVYLIGFDHSYVIPESAKIEGANITSTEDDPNHFVPGYFGKGLRWHDPKTDRMEQSYRGAKKAFEKAGRKIQNATSGGMLEVFERVDYNNLFNSSQPLTKVVK